eukprot:8981654-Pyramimonas_sp.AAC.1
MEFWCLPSKETQDYLSMTMRPNLHGAKTVDWQRRGAKRSHEGLQADQVGDDGDDDPWGAALGLPDAVESAARTRTQWALGDQD